MRSRDESRESFWQRARGVSQAQATAIGYGDYDEMERERYTGADHARSAAPHQSAYGGYGGEFRERSTLLRNFAGKGPRGYVRSDERIFDEVCELLTRSPDVDASDVEVTVSGGEVTLAGTVADPRQKQAAREAAEAARAVRAVHNLLRVREQGA